MWYWLARKLPVSFHRFYPGLKRVKGFCTGWIFGHDRGHLLVGLINDAALRKAVKRYGKLSGSFRLTFPEGLPDSALPFVATDVCPVPTLDQVSASVVSSLGACQAGEFDL
jgi:hypothetical protein